MCDGDLPTALVSLLELPPAFTREPAVYDVLSLTYILLRLYCLDSTFRG